MKIRQNTQEHGKLLRLSQEFLSNKLSAAGVSYVVNSKSKCRRYCWIIVLLITATFMGYMTYKVILEYLQYPKIVVKNDMIRSKMKFPAVTLCTLSPMSKHALKRTSLAKKSEALEILKTVSRQSEQPERKRTCAGDPMCWWDFFGERCLCTSSACATEFCLDSENGKCICAPLMCDSEHIFLQDICSLVVKGDESLCECEANATYTHSEDVIHYIEDRIVDFLVNDPNIRDTINLIRNSVSNDLIDIEDDLMPSAEDIYSYGTQFPDFIISCSYEGRKCAKENFTLYFHEKFGKCFMFNFVGEDSEEDDEEGTAKHIYNFGQSSGLNIIMRINNSESSELLTRELGARIVVHDPHELPPISEYGFNIKVQDYTSVEVTRKNTKRLGPPWGTCEDNGSHLPFKFPYRRYNQVACRKVCKHTYVWEICNCTRRSFLMGHVVGGKQAHHFRFCSSSSAMVTEANCVNKVLGDIEHNRIDCKCYPPCRETQYATSLSTSAINTEFFNLVKGVKTLKPTDDIGLQNFGITGSATMLGLKVYYRTLQVESFEEVPSYSWETLIANVGGNLGFFMGLSIVTFVEVFEFLWDILLSLFRKKKIRDITAATSTYIDSVSQRMKISTPWTTTTVMEGNVKEIDFRMSESFKLGTSSHIDRDSEFISNRNMYTRRCSRLRPRSTMRSRRTGRRITSTETEWSLTLQAQNLLYKDFLKENAEIIIKNRK